MSAPLSSKDEAVKLFQAVFGCSPTHGGCAPGRVNLIGEHTDYNGGFVMPIALHLRTAVVGRVVPGGTGIRIVSTTGGDVEVPSLIRSDTQWANYVLGVLGVYSSNADPVQNISTDNRIELAVAGQVPLGSGLSSSAALEVATAMFVLSVTGCVPKDVGLLCQKAENDWAGVPCGLMDQFISYGGVQGRAMLLDCKSRETTYIPIDDPSVSILVVNSNVKHALCDGEYAKRRAHCEEAVKILGGGITLLREVEELSCLSPIRDVDNVCYRRAKHVVGENRRVVDFASALSSKNFDAAGKLMLESHRSLQHDYEVSCVELDFLVDSLIAMDGVYGARMTGGGFGGSVVSLVVTDKIPQVVKNISMMYSKQYNRECTCMVTSASSGAVKLSL